MIYVSEALHNAFVGDSRQLRARITIGERVFDNDNITSLSLDYGSMDGASFSIGATVASSLKLTFSELVEGLEELDEIKVEMGAVLPDDSVEYVPMGTFIINEEVTMDRNNDKTSLEAMDKMIMLGGVYVSELSGSAPIREIALEIANKVGVEVADTFDRLRADNIRVPEGYTYREAIGLTAQFEAGFATFNRNGKLEIKTLNDPEFRLTPENYISKGLVKNEVFFRLNGIRCQIGDGEEDVLQAGSASGNQVTIRNSSMTQTHLNRIFQELSTLNYYPFTLNWYGNPALEAGDWIEIEDLQGNRFKTPNLSYTLDFNGGLTAKSQAETTSNNEVVYQYRSPLQQQIEWLNARISASGGNHIYDDITQPTNPKEGDLWFKPNGPDTEIWLYTRQEDGSLDWEPRVTNEIFEELRNQIEQMQQDAEQDRINTEAAIDQVKQENLDAVAQAKQDWDIEFAAEIDLINSTLTNGIDQAITDAETYTNQQLNSFETEFNHKIDSVESLANSADQAVHSINQDILNAGFSTITDMNSHLESLTTSAQNRADQAWSNAQSAISNANSAQSTANSALSNAQQALDDYANLEIGGRNLLRNTSFNQGFEFWGGSANNHLVDDSPIPGVKAVELFDYNNLHQTLNGVDTQTYTFSFWVKIVDNPNNSPYQFRVISQGGTVASSDNITSTNGVWQKHTLTRSGLNFNEIRFRASGSVNHAGGIVRVSGFKVEHGTKASDWQPAPQDVQVQITDINGELQRKVSQTVFNDLNTSFEAIQSITYQNQHDIGLKASSQLVNSINQTVENHTAQINTNAYEIQQRATQQSVNNLTGRVTTAEASIITNATQIGLRATQSSVDTINSQINNIFAEFTIQSDRINSKVSMTEVNGALDVLDYENRNLIIRNDELPGAYVANDGIWGELWTRRMIHYIPVQPGERITLTKNSGFHDNSWRLSFYDSNKNYMDRYTHASDRNTFTVPNNVYYLRASYPADAQVKLERGTRATPWSLAPEDTKASIVHVESDLTQTAEEFRLAIIQVNTGLDGKASLQAFNTLDQTVGSTVSRIGDAEDRLNSVESTANGTQQIVSGVNGLVTQISAISSGFDVLAQRSVQNILNNPRFDNGMSGWTRGNEVVLENTSGAGHVFGVWTANGQRNGERRIWVNGDNISDPADLNRQGKSYNVKLKFSFGSGQNNRISFGQGNGRYFETVTGDGNNTVTRTFTFTATETTTFSLYFLDNGYYRIQEVVINETGGATQGQLSVLNDSINLRVEKDDISNQININTQGVRISGNKIHITGQTFIDSAIITSAMINNLNANKVVGTEAEFATIRSRVLITNAVQATHIQANNALIDKITATTAMVNHFFAKTAVINSVNAQTLTAITANITSIRTQILIANSVTSTHIQANNALIDKLFATTALINQLTSKQAFINNIQAISISADQITAGTINFAQIRGINIDASDITTGTLSGANMHLNLNEGVFTTTSQVSNQLAGIMTINYGRLESVSNVESGRFVTLSGDQLHFGDNDGYIELTPRYMDFRANSRTARMRFNGTNFVLDTNLGLYGNHINSVHWMRLANSNTHLQSHPSQNGGALIDSSQITIGLGDRDSFQSIAQFSNNISFLRNVFLGGNNLNGIGQLNLQNSTGSFSHSIGDIGGSVLMDGAAITIGIRSGSGLSFSRRAEFTGRIDFYRNLWMNGYTVGGDSDERLKKHIVDTDQDSLSIINQARFTNFEWNHPDYIKGVQFGLIAQETNESLVMYDSEKDVYGIDMNRLSLTTAHAVQQLDNNVIQLANYVDEQNENILYGLSKHEIRIRKLEDELKEANKKIEQLEGAA